MSINGDKLLKDPYAISSPFGQRIHPITGKRQGHNGTDYATYRKSVPFYAPANGTVLKVGRDKYGGNFSYYGFPSLGYVGLAYHWNSITNKVNYSFSKGQKLGMVGSTGLSTAEHLHWSWIVWNKKALQYNNADYKDFEKYKFPEEVEDLTKQEVIVLIKDILNGGNGEVNPYLVKEFQEAKLKGITDGTYPDRYMRRDEGAVMALRAAGKRYQTLDEIPAVYRPVIKELIDNGFKGTPRGLDLTEDMIRGIIIAKKY